MEVLTKQIMEKFLILYSKHGEKEFGFQEAERNLKTGTELTSKILNTLKKKGWLTTTINPFDGRKRIYQLKNINYIIIKIVEQLRQQMEEEKTNNTCQPWLERGDKK